MITFKKFLIEGGKATAKFEVSRASKVDIEKAVNKLSEILNIPEKTLYDDLLGSTKLTLAGIKKDSGDIDIAFSLENDDMENIDTKMKKAGIEGTLNKGTKVGSYAFPVNGKKIQVDLMFVKNKNWAKFAYHSSHGKDSKYPGAVRNIIMMSAIANILEPGKDFMLKSDEGQLIARASRSMKLDTGIERLFKLATINKKTGAYNKSMEKVDPEEIRSHLKKINRDIEFSMDPDIIDDPDVVAKKFFGSNLTAKDLLTAEDVIKHVKKLKNSREIFEIAKKELEKLNLPVPEEMPL